MIELEALADKIELLANGRGKMGRRGLADFRRLHKKGRSWTSQDGQRT